MTIKNSLLKNIAKLYTMILIEEKKSKEKNGKPSTSNNWEWIQMN